MPDCEKREELEVSLNLVKIERERVKKGFEGRKMQRDYMEGKERKGTGETEGTKETERDLQRGTEFRSTKEKGDQKGYSDPEK